MKTESEKVRKWMKERKCERIMYHHIDTYAARLDVCWELAYTCINGGLAAKLTHKQSRVCQIVFPTMSTPKYPAGDLLNECARAARKMEWNAFAT
jgi:hypothetical protein